MLVLAPQKKHKEQVEKRLAEKKQMYDSVLKMAQEETKIRLSEEMEYLQNSLGNFVVDFEDLANLTFDISQIANEKGVGSFRIASRDSRGSLAIPNCDYICESHIDISFTAEFNQFATFLNALERHRPVIFVDMFTITRSEQEDSGHEANMKLAVFVRKREGG